MARLARFVHPGVPCHVTHRGNRREDIFVSQADRVVYRELLRECAARAGLSIWAYCLMTNHVHLLVVPARKDSLARGIGQAHRHFAQRMNAANRWTGHLFEGRFFSCALDPARVWTCVRYIERNPVRAGAAESAGAWEWSSARAHALGEADDLLAPERPFPGPVADWAAWLALPPEEEAEREIRRATSTGRPCGERSWVRGLEISAGRRLAALPTGRPRNEESSGGADSGAAVLFGE